MPSYVFEDEETKPKQRLSYAFEDEVAPPEPERPVFEAPDPTGMLDYSGGVGPETETNVGAWLKAGGKGVAHALTSTAPAMVNAAARQFVDRSRSLDEAGASSLIDSDQEVETPEYTRAFTKNLSDKLGVGVDVWNAVGRPLELPASATKGEQRAFGVGESLGLVGAVIPFGAVGGPVALGIGTSGQKYDELIRSGVDPERAHKAALITGVAETVPELFSFRIGLSKKIPFLKKAIYGQVSELLGESATSATQLGADIWAMNPGKSREEIAAQYAAEIGDTLTETVIQTMIQAPIQSAGMHGISRLDSAFQSRSEQAARRKYAPGLAGEPPLSATPETGSIAQAEGVEGQDKPLVEEHRIDDNLRDEFQKLIDSGRHSEAFDLAYTDELTGMGSQKGWIRLEKSGQLKDIAQGKSDLVKFKYFNDTYGDAFGDLVLAESGKILKNQPNVKVFRNGGDESAIVSKRNNIDDVIQAYENADKILSEKTFTAKGKDGKLYNIKGVRLVYGTGRNPQEAFDSRRANKERLIAAGEYSDDRGARPRNLLEQPREEGAGNLAREVTPLSEVSPEKEQSKSAPEPWEIPFAGYWQKERKTTTLKLTKQIHKESVKKALSEGKPVPSEVLKDYPNLQSPEVRKAATPSAASPQGPEVMKPSVPPLKDPWAKGAKFAKAPIAKEDLEIVAELRNLIANTQAGGEVLPDGTRTPSTLPEWLRDVGIKRTGDGNDLGLMQKVLRGTPITKKQFEKVDDLIERHRRGAGYGPREREFTLSEPEAPAVKDKPKQEQEKLSFGQVKGEDLRAPERENKPVSMDDLDLGKATNAAKDREKQGSLGVPFAPEKDFRREPDRVSTEENRGNLSRIIEETTSPLKEYLDKTPKAGLAIADISRLKKANDDIKLPEKINLQSVNPEVEGRWQGSKGLTRKGIITKSVEHLQDIWELRKPFPGLDYKKDAPVINILREFSAVPEYSKHVSAETTAGILAGLGPKKYDVFTRNVVLPDILRDVERGLLPEDRLPFGYKNKAEIQKDYDKFKSIANANPDIKASLARREKFTNELTKELVNQKLLPREVLKDDRYFHHQVLQYMNMRRGVGTSSKDVRLHKKGFQKGRQGSNLDYNTEYVEAEFEWVSQAIAQLKTKEIINRIQQVADISAHVKSEAKKQGLSDWKKAIPEGYTIWQPKPGTTWYKTMSVPEKVLEEVLAGNRELTKADLTTVLAKGYVKNEWVVRERVARTLDTFRDFSKDEGFDHFTRSVMASWKQWVLLNPVRVLKYNMNNMSGDLDIALAYDPRILKYFKTAASDAWTNKKGGPMSRDMREAIEYGVVGSGFSIQEIPDVKDIGIFKVLMGNDSNIIARYWEQTKELTQARENILRIAAYKYFKDQLATGKKLYGVSKKELVDAERDPKRKAAMLARDLVGDYGNISKAGQWLREHMIPFWSWMEINTPRYLRLMRNASLEGKTVETAARTGVVLARKAAFKTGKVILQANILYAGIMAWNAVVQNMVGMTDDEKRSLFGNNRQLHLVLGRTDDGEIRTLRIQGALSDALDWFALGDWPDVIRDIREGKKTIGDQFKETIISPLNKIVNSSHPILKTGLEVMTGKQLWPDITKPRPIRDKAEYVTRLVSLDMPFRYLTGKPTRGGLKDLLGAVTYTSDPSEAAYWTARKMTYDYLEKTGKEIPSADPTSRSNALYYYKQAKRFKDEKAADKYLKEYINLGGNILGIDTSIKRAAPLGAIPMRQREEFLNSLTLEDARQISLAEKWYEKIMTLTDEERDKISMLSEKE